MVSTTFSSSRPVIRREEGGSSTATANQQSSLPPLRCCSGRPVDQLSELAKRSKARRMVPPRGRLALLLLLALSAALAPGRAAATGVFEVRRKFPCHDGSGKHLANLRAHDARRHGRSLAAAVDLPLGGNALPYETGLYFTQIGIGTPAKSYYVQVDTSSDIFWVNCVFCDTCPRKSGLGVLPSLPFPLQLLCSADLIHRGRGGGHSAAPLVQLQPVLVQARQDRGAHGRQGRLGAAPVATAPPRLPNKVTQWFGLHIGVSFWEAVNLTNMHPSSTIWKEVLTVAQGDSMSVCVINFGTRTPFVSSLELRPLQDAMYPFVNSSMSISYFRRIRFGTATEYITRYPLDPYDRFWEGWSFSYNTYPWMTLNTSTQVRRLPGDNTFQVPEGILQGATTLDTNYSFFEINVAAGPNLDAKNLQLLPIFHFAEINISNQNRRFDIYSDNDLLFPDFSPSRFQADSMHQNGRFLHNPAAIFLLNKTRSSRLPPLINAFEVYSPVRMDNLTTDAEDAHYMNEVKKHYNLARINWNGDPCSPREYSWEGLTCDYSKRNQNPRIVAVDLSTSGLKGGLVIAFMNMVSLENLDLSHNNLTGAIPDYQIKSLRVLDLSYNQLDGPIPDSILQRSRAGILDLRLEGNPVCSKVKDTYCSNKKKNKSTMLIAVIVPVVLVSLLVVMCILWKLCWKGKSADNEDYAMYEEETPLHIDIRRFTYADLKHITNDFKQIVGKGGFGTVYHGTMENGDEVAVKVLMETSIAESTDFLPEVQTLSKVHHKNLVTLQGYCQNTKCLALVYDFMPRGNLQQLLREGDDYSLTWEQRLHIALDSAQGLEYLHESCTPSIVHRDVKTANILLDKNLVGIIADFGLSRAFNDAHTHISTVAAGTLGYLDPEYHATFQLTIKTDVYSFGIVLLEIITGKPPVLMDPHTYHLPNWVRQKIAKGGIQDIVDKRLLDQYDPSSLQSVVDLAMNCVESAAVDRPSMTEVVSRLKVLLPTTPSSKVYASASSTKSTNDIMRKQFQLLISGDGNEESSSSFQSGYTNQSGYTSRMAELPALSGR